MTSEWAGKYRRVQTFAIVRTPTERASRSRRRRGIATLHWINLRSVKIKKRYEGFRSISTFVLDCQLPPPRLHNDEEQIRLIRHIIGISNSPYLSWRFRTTVLLSFEAIHTSLGVVLPLISVRLNGKWLIGIQYMGCSIASASTSIVLVPYSILFLRGRCRAAPEAGGKTAALCWNVEYGVQQYVHGGTYTSYA